MPYILITITVILKNIILVDGMRSDELFPFFLIESSFVQVFFFFLNHILLLEIVSSLHGLDLTQQECPVTADT